MMMMGWRVTGMDIPCNRPLPNPMDTALGCEIGQGVMAMSDAIRQIRARARRKAAGLVRLEFWVPEDRRDDVREAVRHALQQAGVPAAVATDTGPDGDTAPVVHRRRQLITDIDGLLD